MDFYKKQPKIAEIMRFFNGKSILKEFIRKDGKFYGKSSKDFLLFGSLRKYMAETTIDYVDRISKMK